MGVLVHHFQSVAGDLSVDLGGGQIGVAKKLLDRPQVGSTLQEMGREGMSQRVGM